MINVGIIGLGLIGQQRAEDISRLDNVELYGGFDTDKELSKTISSKFGFESFNSSDELIASSQINLIVIAVPHVHSALYVISSLKAGKHVLCEKPMGITVSEAERILQVSKDTGKLVEPGFNYRYYPAIRKAKVLIDSNKIGKLISSRIVIGHGGRPGMENEWKLEREKSGGGSLIDP